MRHNSFPVAGSYEIAVARPITINSVRALLVQTYGDDHPEVGLPPVEKSRATLQICLPVFASIAAANDLPSLSCTTNTRPSCTAGDAAVPKSRYIGCGSNFAFHS